MILEVAVLNVRPGEARAFEQAFGQVHAGSLEPSGTGDAKLLLKGGGSLLPAPALPFAQTSAVRAQLVRSAGTECWEASFTPPVETNDGVQFKDKLP
jgi:hypothetical protein